MATPKNGRPRTFPCKKNGSSLLEHMAALGKRIRGKGKKCTSIRVGDFKVTIRDVFIMNPSPAILRKHIAKRGMILRTRNATTDTTATLEPAQALEVWDTIILPAIGR